MLVGQRMRLLSSVGLRVRHPLAAARRRDLVVIPAHLRPLLLRNVRRLRVAGSDDGLVALAADGPYRQGQLRHRPVWQARARPQQSHRDAARVRRIIHARLWRARAGALLPLCVRMGDRVRLPRPQVRRRVHDRFTMRIRRPGDCNDLGPAHPHPRRTPRRGPGLRRNVPHVLSPRVALLPRRAAPLQAPEARLSPLRHPTAQ